jgi:hypothetical protein
MKRFDFKTLLPHLLAVLLFAVLAGIYFGPELQGKKLAQSDITQFKGMSKEIMDYREATGEEALWTNRMFGGMPAYQISVKYPKPVLGPLDSLFKLFSKGGFGTVFLYMIGFYILMMSLRIDPWLAILGSIAYGFSSYFFIILEAGHTSKAFAIGYMPAVLGGFILLFQRHKYLLGSVVTALFLGLQLMSNHPQITYYMLLCILILGLFFLVDAFKEQTLPHLFKASGLFIVSALLALGMSATRFLTTAEYAPSTIRGASELSTEAGKKSSGLDFDYATQWSYGIGETWTLLVPNFKGGGSGAIGNNETAMEAVSGANKQSIQGSVDQYWGDQPFTSGPVYAGAAVFLLFLLALWLERGPLKWGLLAAAILAILLSWGKNLPGFTQFFMDYFPMYNKFRAVSMTLVIVELVLPLLAILGLHRLIQERDIVKLNMKTFYAISGGLLALLLLMYVTPTLFTDFFKTGELDNYSKQLSAAGFKEVQMNGFLDDMVAARMAIFKADVLRSFFIILISAALLWAFITDKIKSQVLVIALALITLMDLWSVDKRYVNDESFVSKRDLASPFQESRADKIIKKDKDPYFRVLNLTARLDQDSRTSYFHNSLGGYHGAKLGRYQELIDGQLNQNNREVINMLNTKYFITQGEDGGLSAVPNTEALGNAWFVDSLLIVSDADAEMSALSEIDPSNTATLDERFLSQVEQRNWQTGPDANISLTSYGPKELMFRSKNPRDGFATFSDIYYQPGWNAYIDGELKDHVRVDYVLRGLEIPAGDHDVIFRFEPKSVSTGNLIVYLSSGLFLILLLFTIYKSSKATEAA